jgi:hypothetical protein
MDTLITNSDMVLQLLRQLPPRERLHVIVDALLDLAQILPGPLPVSDFWEGADIRALAESQGVQPVDDFDALLGGWPEDESVDDFIRAIRAERRRNPV